MKNFKRRGRVWQHFWGFGGFSLMIAKPDGRLGGFSVMFTASNKWTLFLVEALKRFTFPPRRVIDFTWLDYLGARLSACAPTMSQ